MTYRELLQSLTNLTNEQLDCDVTIELEFEDECFPAELRICGATNDLLAEGHPVIFALA